MLTRRLASMTAFVYSAEYLMVIILCKPTVSTADKIFIATRLRIIFKAGIIFILLKSGTSLYNDYRNSSVGKNRAAISINSPLKSRERALGTISIQCHLTV